jgi:hypothetical protein
MVMRRIFGLERERAGEKCIMRSFVICSLHPNLIMAI